MTITHYPVAWRKARKEKRFPTRGELSQQHHGVRGNLWTELYYFSRGWWKRFFQRHGWSVVRMRGNRVFYTGNQWFGGSLSWSTREKLPHIFGSCCNIFLLARGRELEPSLLPAPVQAAPAAAAAEPEVDFNITPEILAIQRLISPSR